MNVNVAMVKTIGPPISSSRESLKIITCNDANHTMNIMVNKKRFSRMRCSISAFGITMQLTHAKMIDMSSMMTIMIGITSSASDMLFVYLRFSAVPTMSISDALNIEINWWVTA